MMSNVLTVVSKSLRGAITCVKLDADKYPGLASRYKIKALPTLVLFKVSGGARAACLQLRTAVVAFDEPSAATVDAAH